MALDIGELLSVQTSGGGGGGGAATIVVPGNAAALFARANSIDAAFDLTVVDPNTLTLQLPASTQLDDMWELIAQLTYVFGAVSASDLGWLTVTAKGIYGLADSSDVGGAPDYIPVVGTVTFTPGLSRPIRVLATNQFLAVAPFTATFDSDGELSYDGVKNVRIIAPLWTGLSNTDWRWTAEVKPGPGQSWSGFSVNFTGAPGSIVNLAALIG